ncbi:25383_t:CDS:2, partial [Gigaspora rosea]
MGKNGKLRRQFVYFSLGQRLSIQYRDYDRATELRYRPNYVMQNNNNQIGDIFDGTRYKELVQDGHFQDECDVALVVSIDGYQIFRQKTDDCWVVLVINANLAPEIRFKKENLLINLIIPGPKEPKNLNTFLYPMIKELQNLEEGIKCYDAIRKESFTLRCRYCNLKSIRTNHIYYLTILPTNVNSIRYCASNLPSQTHEEWKERLKTIRNAKSEKNENLPSKLGRPLRNIMLHNRGYKAEEWAAWITMYSLLLLKGQLPLKYYNGWYLFVKAVRLCQKKIISAEDLNDNNNLLLKFYAHYERIHKNGPCWATWQFPIECVCGMLFPLARSRLYPYKNIINNIYMIELFNHLKFYKQINQSIFLPVQEAVNSNQINFSAEGYEEQFLGPIAQYILSKAELKKLKNHYITNYNVTSNQLQSFTFQVQKFGRLCTKYGYYIGSSWITQNPDWAHIIYSVL